MFKRIILPILILFSISFAISGAFTSNLKSATILFVSVSIGQIAIYQVYQQWVIFMSEKIMNERIREFSKQGVDIVCPCSKACKQFIPIRLNEDNDYQCLDCNKNVRVDVNVSTFLKTEPIDLPTANKAIDIVYDETTRKVIDGVQI